jgi:hypothetical protein
VNLKSAFVTFETPTRNHFAKTAHWQELAMAGVKRCRGFACTDANFPYANLNALIITVQKIDAPDRKPRSLAKGYVEHNHASFVWRP